MPFPVRYIIPRKPDAWVQVANDATTASRFDHDAPTVHVSEEHPFMNDIRKAVLTYRLQSAAHFENDVGVAQVAHAVPKSRFAWSRKIKVNFRSFNRLLQRICRPKSQKRACMDVSTPAVEVLENNKWISLDDFLGKQFPILPGKIPYYILQAWWEANGKTFNWKALPTELKEHVLQFCLHEPLDQEAYDAKMQRSLARRRPGFGSSREPGVYEIVEKLREWSALLRVSHQVRAITLRLCFAGSHDLAMNQFCIFPQTFSQLYDTICRLGQHYQMVEQDSLPVDKHTQTLADCYRQYPRIYPQLKQYATFRHGIHKISIKMDFLSYMHFFRVTAGGFERYHKPGSMTYTVLERLPNLKYIAIRLPGRPRRGFHDFPSRRGPRLFHEDAPCPRLLHRIIYEQAAVVLAHYPSVRIKAYIDEEEKDRFYEIQERAIAQLKFTATELEELYAECGGGVQLEEWVQPGNGLPPVGDTESDDGLMRPIRQEADAFFPPKCLCTKRCTVII